jgi:hypothetical protein
MNKKIYGFDKFFEKKLTLSDLKTDKTRGNTLVGKLKNKEKLELDSGAQIEVDKMKDPDIDGAWEEPEVAVKNLVDASGEFDILKATDYFKNTKPKDKRINKLKANTYVPVLQDKTGKEYMLTDLKKNINFGSTGAGLRIREHESIQMIFLAKRLHDGVDYPGPTTIKGKYYYPEMAATLETMVGTSSFEFGDITLKLAPGFILTEEMSKYYGSDQSWLSTFSNVPNKLAKQVDSTGKKILSPNIAYTIFHTSNKEASSTANVIFAKFKALSKMRPTPSTNESIEELDEPNKKYFSRLPYPEDTPKYIKPFDRASKEEIDFSKYCPADIFIVDTNSINDLNKGIMACEDILELNTYLNDSFNDRQIIPVSLKRVGPSPNSAMLIINAEEKMKLPSFHVSSFRISADVNKGIGSKIMTDSKWKNNGKTINRERNLTMDSPNTRVNNNIDGEIDGLWARHGKVSLVWIKKFIEGSDYYRKIEDLFDKYSDDEVDEKLSVEISEWKTLSDKKVDELKHILSKVQEDIDLMESKSGSLKLKVRHDLGGKDIGGIQNKLISKIQSLQVIRALCGIYFINPAELDKVVTKMLLYALSIQNPGFSSPKYVRVI